MPYSARMCHNLMSCQQQKFWRTPQTGGNILGAANFVHYTNHFPNGSEKILRKRQVFAKCWLVICRVIQYF